MKRIILAVCCVLLLAAPAFATGQRQVQCLNGGCQVQAFAVAPQVIYQQPLVVQQLAVPYVQQQVIVQKQVVQKQRSNFSSFQRQRSGGRSSSVLIQRQRSR